MIDLFPGMNFNLRGSALRCDVVTPLAPDKVMIEFRGLGLKTRHEEERQTRVNHPQLDLGPVRSQPARGSARRHRTGRNMLPGSEPRRICTAVAKNQTHSRRRMGCATTTANGASG